MDRAVYDALKAKVVANKTTANKAAELGGFWTRTTQSDKLGYDWSEDWLGEKLIRQVYVEQTQPKGTADNPIVLEDGGQLIPNAYYLVDGARYVWMGGASVCETVTATLADNRFVAF